MNNIYLVTGNLNKLAEWRRLLPSNITLEAIDIDLPEIQSMDGAEIVADKAKRAYEATGKPVVVEDVSAGLEKLIGLPGPFIKFFFKAMGEDALYKLADGEGESATVICSIAYYDGTELISVSGKVEGTIVAPRGDNGFGFDKVFMPKNNTKTFGEMSQKEKDQVSHRALAIKLFINTLNDNAH